MRILATKQPIESNFVYQKPVKKAVPVMTSWEKDKRSLSSSPTMLQRKHSCPCGGGCPRCQEEALMQTKSKANA